MAAGAGRAVRTARTDAGVGPGCPCSWGSLRGYGVGTLGQPLAVPGPQFAQPQKGPGGGLSGDGSGLLGSRVSK